MSPGSVLRMFAIAGLARNSCLEVDDSLPRSVRAGFNQKSPGCARLHVIAGMRVNRKMYQGHNMKVTTILVSLLLSVLVGCGVGVHRKQRMFALLGTEQVNTLSAVAYRHIIREADDQQVLNTDDATVRRLRRIAADLVDAARVSRVDARQWRWEVNVIQSDVMNVNCLPGGKILFYSGLIDRLKLTDDEIAAITSHETAHALLGHWREAISEAYAVEPEREAVDTLPGPDDHATSLAINVVQYALTLPDSRKQETEADILGLELMARAGYHPQAAVTLWQKMAKQTADGHPPEFMSIHPAMETRMAILRYHIPRVMPLYHQAQD